jgi:hypothetical protein
METNDDDDDDNRDNEKKDYLASKTHTRAPRQ